MNVVRRRPHRRPVVGVITALLLAAGLLVAPATSAATVAPTNGSISGTVSRDGGAKPADIAVYLFDSDAPDGDVTADALLSTTTLDSGGYKLTNVPAGSYKIKFRGAYVTDQYWVGATDFDDATIFDVEEGEQVTGMDAHLADGNFIYGSVSGADGVAGMRLQVTVYRREGSGPSARWIVHRVEKPLPETPDRFGAPGLPMGTYRLKFEDLSGRYGPQFGDGVIDLERAPEYTFTQAAWRYLTVNLVKTNALANTVRPSLDYYWTAVGNELIASPGQWTPGAPTFSYQWLADGVPIPDAQSQRHVTTQAQAGKRLSVRVTAQLSGLDPVTADSPSTSIVPSELTSLTAGGRSTRTATISWSPVPGATGYWVAGGAGHGGPIGNMTSYTLQGLAPGSAYRAMVRAEFADGMTSSWRGVDVYTSPGQPAKPSPSKVSKTSVRLRLGSTAGASRYVITYRTGKSRPKTLIVGGRSRSVTLKKLKKKTSYRVTITAMSAHQVPSVPSRTVTVRTKKK